VPTEINSGWIWNAATGAWPSLQVVFLLSLRVATTFLMTPVLYAMPMPTVVRMLLVLSLSLTIALGIAAPVNMARVDTGALWSAAFAEVALGATLALGILLAFAAFDVAGRLLDIQIGFGIAQVFDPVDTGPDIDVQQSGCAAVLFSEWTPCITARYCLQH
jgi:flagellar biosynthesis protein FliR